MNLPPMDDPCWSRYDGAYRERPFDVRPLIGRFQRLSVDDALWAVVWAELYHQGDVGEASYALVAALTSYLSQSPELDGQALHFAATVELARASARNPRVPPELQEAYEHALHELPRIALASTDVLWQVGALQGFAALVAVTRGHRLLGQAYQNMNEVMAANFLREEIGLSD